MKIRIFIFKIAILNFKTAFIILKIRIVIFKTRVFSLKVGIYSLKIAVLKISASVLDINICGFILQKPARIKDAPFTLIKLFFPHLIFLCSIFFLCPRTIER